MIATARAMRAMKAEHCMHDAHIGVWFDGDDRDENASAATKTFHAVNRLLKRLGFELGRDRDIETQYRSLNPTHRRGRFGDLEVKTNVTGRCVEIDFFQNIVRENRHGGEYDFNKVSKMPYVVRLRFQWAVTKLRAFLTDRGIAPRVDKIDDWINDPEQSFHDKWDFDSDRKRGHRFPMEKLDAELRKWPQLDADGVQTFWRQTKFVRINGRWLRCRVFDGINSMWRCMTETSYLTCANVGHLHTKFPGRGRQFTVKERTIALERELKDAIEDKKFLRAHRLQQVLLKLTEATR